MTPNSNIKLAIDFTNPELDADDRDEQAQRLLGELRQLDEVETVDRVLDPNPPEGNKAIGGILVGLLTTQVSAVNAQKVMGFLGDRLGGKPIELQVEDNGRKLTVKAHSREELAEAIKAATAFINA